MRLLEVFGLLTFPVFWVSRYFLSKQVETSPVQDPCLECPKISRDLPKILPKLRNQPEKVKNIKYIPEFSEYVKNDKNIPEYWKINGLCRKNGIDVHPAIYLHSNNAFKTVLARSGAEIKGFLCYGHFWSESN